MSAPMVKACLREDDPKSQTRRIAKFVTRENGYNLNFSGLHPDKVGDLWILSSMGNGCWNERTIPMRCPYGKPGDLLWVRERGTELRWAYGHDPLSVPGGRDLWTHCGYRYHADGAEIYIPGYDPESGFEGKKDRVSIHMPRWASRLTLRITDVRVDRLHSISEDDAKAEGCGTAIFETIVPVRASGVMHSAACYRAGYACLWDQINGAGSWQANPWIWALTFDVIRKNVDEVLRNV